MSDASVSFDCSEVVILDASAVTVISHIDNDDDVDAVDDDENHQNHHHKNTTPNKGERYNNNPPIAAVAAGRMIPRNINDYIHPPQNNTNNNLNTNLNNNHHDNDDDNDELPSLANLVAATIRDRVVLEQMEEIRLLKAQLSSSQRVEITGPNGTPVYARGNFSNGDFNTVSLQSIENDDDSMMMNDHDTTGLFWDVGLEMVEQQCNHNNSDSNDDHAASTASSNASAASNSENSVVPLNNLSNIEIRIGGVLYVTTAEVEGTSMAFGIRPGNKFDLHRGQRDMTRSAVAEFNTEDDAATGSRSALLTFHIRDFPRGHWRSLQSVAMLNRSIALRQQEREEQREERRELRREERSERIERGELDPMEMEGEDLEEFESDYESDYDEEEDQDPLDVYNYLTLCLSKRHPKQMADITSVSFCVKSVRGRIESLSRGEVFEQTKTKVFRRIDDVYQEELDGMDTLEEAGATLYDD